MSPATDRLFMLQLARLSMLALSRIIVDRMLVRPPLQQAGLRPAARGRPEHSDVRARMRRTDRSGMISRSRASMNTLALQIEERQHAAASRMSCARRAAARLVDAATAAARTVAARPRRSDRPSPSSQSWKNTVAETTTASAQRGGVLDAETAFEASPDRASLSLSPAHLRRASSGYRRATAARGCAC